MKRDSQEFLQEHNRNRSDSDGRPDREEDEICDWAREHDLPYFDGQVHFPDYRIEYEIDGYERHEDVEPFTPYYRGAHAVSREDRLPHLRCCLARRRSFRSASAHRGGIPVASASAVCRRSATTP
ncbi:MAG: hypothetical protein ACRD15_11545 [Vicinamibacterales bacterium]